MESAWAIPRQHLGGATSRRGGSGHHRRRLDGVSARHDESGERRRGCDGGPGAAPIVLPGAVPADVPQQSAGRLGVSAAGGRGDLSTS